MRNYGETAMNSNRFNGFTLIELLITVVIVAILAAIALPSYKEHVVKSRRSAAQSEMMSIANKEEQFLLANRQYADKDAIEASGYALPSAVSSFYDYDIEVDNSAAPTYTITFTAIDDQESDGDLTLDNQGVKTPSAKWK